MSVGLPLNWCNFIDGMTFHLFSGQIFQMANGFYYDVDNQYMPTVMFLIVFGIIFSLVFYLIIMIEKRPAEKHTLGIILFFSIIFRLILLPSELIHENDIYRYLWDGKSLIHGINPYKHPPLDLKMYEMGSEEMATKNFSEKDKLRIRKLISLRDQKPVYFARISYKDVPTIYPPVAQGVFALSAFLRQDSILLMKFIFVLFDVGVIFLIIGLLRYFNRNPCYCLVYAWSPLVLKEFANSGHYDSLAIFLTMLGIYYFVNKSGKGMTASLAMATLSKFYAIVLIPLARKIWKKRDLLLFVGLINIFYLPFFIMDLTGVNGVFEGLITYHREWAYNSSIFAFFGVLLSGLFPHIENTYSLAKIIVGLIYLGILFKLYRDKDMDDLKVMHRCFIAIAALFILSPVGDPWYFCWVMPFLCFFPYRSWVILSGLLILSYINFQDTYPIVYEEIFNIRLLNWLIYLPFFILLLIETRLKPRYINDGTTYGMSAKGGSASGGK